MHDEAKERYYAELKINLSRLGLTAEEQENGLLEVKSEDALLCYVHGDGSVSYKSEVENDKSLSALKDKVSDQAETVAEYMRLMEKAPVLVANGLEDRYMLLADFNGTVLAGMHTRYGVQFATWDWDLDGAGVHWGHYHGNSYAAAKEDFAVRSGLIPEQKLFKNEQLIEIYRCCADTLDAGFDLTYEQEECIRSVQEKIEREMPDIRDRIIEQDQRTEELTYGQEQKM